MKADRPKKPGRKKAGKKKDATTLFQGEKIDSCAKPSNNFEVLRRELDGTIYAFRCKECGGTWKIYQNRYHTGNCSQKR